MRYLLDTNAVSDLMKNPKGNVAKHIERVGEASICTSAIVAAELRFGASKKGSPRILAEVEALLGRLEILPFEPPADAAYGLIRANLEKQGQPMDGNDLLIAAQAIAFGYTLVTNDGAFPRVEGLVWENWILDPA
jgi:tRNA(fMet)-specific endonuclease VapC